MFIHFSIRQMLKRDFGVDLPISGGIGNSLADPIIIESPAGEDYQLIETEYLKYICLGRGVKWEFLKRESVESEGRNIDKVKIKTQETTQEEVVTQIENYYFDVTECIVPPSQRQKTHRDFPDLINELEARDTVFRMDFDSAKRRQKAPWLASFGKGDMQKEDEALWQKLVTGLISEEDALSSMTDLMERYYSVHYPLDRAWKKRR